MSTMTLEQEVDLVRAVLRGYPQSLARSDAERALNRIDAYLRERESAKGADLHDRVEFALRDAGFSLDEASTIAQRAVAPRSGVGLDELLGRERGYKNAN